MADSDSGGINRFRRYEKESDRLILEEHSAGCGGILLRWRNAVDGDPVRLMLAHSGEATLFIDGKEAKSHRMILSVGSHQLAIRVTQPMDAPQMFGLVGLPDDPDSSYYDEVVVPGLATGQPGWRFKQVIDADDRLDWIQPEFDDQDWLELPTTSLSEDNYDHWKYRHVQRLGGVLLNTEPSSGGYQELWARKAFVIGGGQ